MSIKKTIESWPLQDVKKGTDVFGECLIEEYLGGTIPENKTGKIPEGVFNVGMSKSLIELSEDFAAGKIDIDQAEVMAIKIITSQENYN